VNEDLGSDGFDESGIFGQRNEQGRRNRTKLRVCPAQQRLHSDQCAIADAVNRLIDQRHLAALPCNAQVLLQAHPLFQPQAHAGSEKAVCVLSRALGVIHRDIDMLEHRTDGIGISRVKRDPDRTAEDDLAPGDPERLGQQLTERVCQRLGAGLDIAALDQRHELISAKTRHQRVRACDARHTVGQTLGKLHQQSVAGIVPKGVVDLLEVVQVEEQQGEFNAFARIAVHPPLERLAQGQPVGQSGQMVAVGHLPHSPFLSSDADCHVGEGAHQFAQFVLPITLQQNAVEATLLN